MSIILIESINQCNQVNESTQSYNFLSLTLVHILTALLLDRNVTQQRRRSLAQQ